MYTTVSRSYRAPDAVAELLKTPRQAAALDLPSGLLTDLVLRRMLSDGRTSLHRLSEGLALTHTIMEPLVTQLRDLSLLELDGMEGRDWKVSLTNAGKAQATDRMRQCTYAGVAPVSLEQYRKVIEAQSPQVALNREMLARAMSDLVIEPRLIDELGPAIASKGAMFLYGPPGTGKSSLAERLIRAYGDAVAVPHAVCVDGQIISVFDPTIHIPLEEQPDGLDARWIACERPCVVAGGELSPEMLDLQYDRNSGTYTAPLQMKANNGVFVIDDFGRQTMTPEQMLNRWIVPLDRAHDYLALAYGVKFTVPFDVKVAFSTNLPPSRLGDEAFFRRLHHKIYIGGIDDDQFDWVLVRVAQKYGIECGPAGASYLRQVVRQRGDGELRPYIPGVACSIIKSIATYEGRRPVLDETAIDKFATTYYTRVIPDGDEAVMPLDVPPAPVAPAAPALVAADAMPPAPAFAPPLVGQPPAPSAPRGLPVGVSAPPLAHR